MGKSGEVGDLGFLGGEYLFEEEEGGFLFILFLFFLC